MGSPTDRGSGWPIGVSAHPHPPIAPTPTQPKVYLLQEHPGLRGTPLAMLAAQCNKLSSMSPPPLADAAVGKGFHPWKKGGGSPEQAASVSRQGGTQSTPTSNQPSTASTFSTSPQQATSPSPAYGETFLLLIIMISVRAHFLSEYARSRWIAGADAAGVMPKYLHHPNSCRGIFPWLWHTHTTCGQTCHDGCAVRDRSPSPHPGPPPTRQIIRWPTATLHRAVISTFSPQMGGRAHDSSRQSIGCQISIVGPALPPLLRACSRKRARFLPLDSHDTRRQPPLLSLIGCAHATPTSCICLYLTPLNNPLLQALLPRAFTPSPPRLRRRCRAKWRPPRPPSLERLTRRRRQPTFRCRACTAG